MSDPFGKEPPTNSRELKEDLDNEMREMFRLMATTHRDCFDKMPGEEFVSGYVAFFQASMTDRMSMIFSYEVASLMTADAARHLFDMCMEVLEVLKGDEQ